MKYYKHPETGEVFAYESEAERAEWGAPDLVELTEAEVEAHLNPPPPPPVVPESVSSAQGQAQLIIEGYWPDVLAYVDSIEDPTKKALAHVALHVTKEYRRDSPFYNEIADHLGLSEEQKDELIIKASKIYL